MRLGISGKGGVGKTTTSAVLSRTLARRGHRVIAIDCDSDPNLGANIGLGEDGADRLRPFLDQSGSRRFNPVNRSAAELLVAIPEDPAVPAADRASMCVLDSAPDSEAVKAIGRLADRLEARFAPA